MPKYFFKEAGDYRIYQNVRSAAQGLLRGKYKHTNQAQINKILDLPKMGGYEDEATRLFHKRINMASREAGANWHKVF